VYHYSRFLVGQDGTVINLEKDDGEVEPSDLGVYPKNVKQWCIDDKGRIIKEKYEDFERKSRNNMVRKEIERRNKTGKHGSFIMGPNGETADLSELGIDLEPSIQ
jgi:hypothetical protein